jgi:hypothetical protein
MSTEPAHSILPDPKIIQTKVKRVGRKIDKKGDSVDDWNRIPTKVDNRKPPKVSKKPPTISKNPVGDEFFTQSPKGQPTGMYRMGGMMAPARHGKGPSRIKKMPDIKR